MFFCFVWNQKNKTKFKEINVHFVWHQKRQSGLCWELLGDRSNMSTKE